jgi:predicted ATPase
MITKWSIQNFKSFRNRTDLELAPVTIFAGANSSGKSSIIQSLLLLKQTVQYAPPTRAMALNGPLVKLGAFSDVKNATSEGEFVGIAWELELLEFGPELNGQIFRCQRRGAVEESEAVTRICVGRAHLSCRNNKSRS